MGVGGEERRTDPELVTLLQPTLPVADASRITPYLQEERELYVGGFIGPTGTRSPFVVINAAPGGTVIDWFMAYAFDNLPPTAWYTTFLQSEFLAADSAVPSGTDGTVNQWNLGRKDSETVVRGIRVTAANQPPAMSAGAAIEICQSAVDVSAPPYHFQNTFIPPGQKLSIAIWTYDAAVPFAANFALRLRDVTEPSAR
jgi:hypothetical protein